MLRAPTEVEERVAIEHLARALEKYAQDIHLAQAELDGRLALFCAQLCGEHGQLAQRKSGALVGAFRRLKTAAGDGADARDQLLQAEGLHDVIVGAELEAEHFVDLLRL